MIINPIYLANRQGIPRIQTSAIDIGTTSIKFTVPSTSICSNDYSGLILLKFNQELPSGTTTTLPIVVTSALCGDKNITVAGGSDWTAANFTSGIHLCYYESSTSTLQLIA